MTLNAIVPLECLRSGEWAEVRDIEGQPKLVARLAELGLRVGVRLRMIHEGSPCLIQIGGGRLSLRGDEEMLVLVRPLTND